MYNLGINRLEKHRFNGGPFLSLLSPQKYLVIMSNIQLPEQTQGYRVNHKKHIFHFFMYSLKFAAKS